MSRLNSCYREKLQKRSCATTAGKPQNIHLTTSTSDCFFLVFFLLLLPPFRMPAFQNSDQAGKCRLDSLVCWNRELQHGTLQRQNYPKVLLWADLIFDRCFCIGPHKCENIRTFYLEHL